MYERTYVCIYIYLHFYIYHTSRRRSARTLHQSSGRTKSVEYFLHTTIENNNNNNNSNNNNNNNTMYKNCKYARQRVKMLIDKI